MHTTIYFKCPGCGQTALVRETAGSYQCASCGLDYMKLGKDKLDAALVENMRPGSGGVLMALALHQFVGGMPPKESVEYVKALARTNGITIPEFKQPRNFFQKILYFIFPSLGIKKVTGGHQ